MDRQKTFPHLPKELTSKCHALIKQVLRKRRANLAADLWQREMVAFIATRSDLFEIWGLAVYWFKMRRLVWIAFVLIAASGYFSLYCLLALLPAFVLERVFARQQKAMYLLLASIVLALEMLATNFAGLGDVYPEARKEANSAFIGFSPIIKTVLLDKYLPKRNEMSPELLKAFASTT